MFTNHTDTKDLRAAIARERDSKARQLNAEEWAARAGTSPHEVRTIVLGDDVFV
ncbi:MAG: hypothetical protein HOW73_00730, partial [Polyangiaceae bacterium]|nr:hypothetical protein [Polyangiaceae bacterium]